MLLLDSRIVQFGKFPNGETNLNHNKLQFFSGSEVTLKFESDDLAGNSQSGRRS